MRDSMRRWHLWLGWIAGPPLLLWVVSGLVMVSKPIAETRSEGALSAPVPLHAGAIVAPRLESKTIRSLVLADGPAGRRWRIGLADGSAAAADAQSGEPLPRLTAAQAVAAAEARYIGSAKIEGVRFVDRDHRPREFGRPVDAWQVRLDDGMHLYVDAWSGEVLVARSSWWRMYDVFWGLHIMDLQGRENPNNPWVVTFVLVALASMLIALILLPAATQRLIRSGAKAEKRE